MIKRTVLYGQPDDTAAFDEHYFNTHIPLARQMPHVAKLEISRVAEVTGTSTPAYYMVAELYYEDEAALKAAVESPEGKAVAADVPKFATGGVTVVRSEVVDV
jgi:uncharacterized protein (TIGR02118 family)